MQMLDVREDADIEDLNDEEIEALRETARRVIEEGESLQEALGLSEDFVGTMEYYAHKLYQHDRYEDCGVLVEAVLALDETRYYPYLLAGDVAIQEGHWEEAVQCLAAAREYGPEEAMIEGKLGEALLRVGRVEDGVVHLQNAIAVADDPEARYKKRSEVLLGVVRDVAEAEAS